jgi:PAS domain S-box-containing protein
VIFLSEPTREENRNQWLASFPEMNPNPVIEINAQGEITFANPATLKILKDLGFPQNPEFFVPDDKEEILRMLREPAADQIYREINLNNAWFSENITLNRELQVVRIYTTDITWRKRMEEELRRAYDHTSTLLESISDSFIALDKDWRFTYVNRRALEYMNKSKKDVLGKVIWDVLPAIVGTPLETFYKNAMACLEPCTFKNTSVVSVGEQFELHVYPMAGGLTIIGQNITERELADTMLRQRDEQLMRARELLEAVTKETDVIIAVQDINFHYLYFNDAYQQEIKRLTGKEITIGTSMVEVFADLPKEQKRTINEWSRVLNGEIINQNIAFGNNAPDRKVYHVLHTPIRDAYGTITGAGEVAFDITKQLQVENELHETREYLDNLIASANGPIIVWDPQFRITLFNRAFEHLSGRNTKDIIGQGLEILLPEKYLARAMDLIKKTSEGERWESVEIPILHKKGEIRTVLWNSAAIFEADGKTLVSTIAQGQDITERKKIESEHRLKASEYAKMNVELEEEILHRKSADANLNKTLSLLHASLESTADGILVVDREGTVTSHNQNFVTMWNIPPDIVKTQDNQKIITYFQSQIRDPDGFLVNMNDLLLHPSRESYDMIELNDGRVFERYSKPQKIGKDVVGRVWSFRDITDRKHSEENLVASLQEKEVLLREIHHRVKNNLQLVTGLLDMTRMRTQDEATTAILTDMMLKIQTMAQIHTRLYESKQFGKIGLTGQFRDQVAALSNIYSHKGHEISCEIHAEEIFLPVDQALPCALVINEILSNSYKHAFKGKKHGTIDVTAVQDNGQIKITIKDDGIGIPPDFDISNTNSLGMKLVRTLVKHQLKGSLHINSHHGTEMIVEFPLQTTRT